MFEFGVVLIVILIAILAGMLMHLIIAAIFGVIIGYSMSKLSQSNLDNGVMLPVLIGGLVIGLIICLGLTADFAALISSSNFVKYLSLIPIIVTMALSYLVTVSIVMNKTVSQSIVPD